MFPIIFLAVKLVIKKVNKANEKVTAILPVTLIPSGLIQEDLKTI